MNYKKKVFFFLSFFIVNAFLVMDAYSIENSGQSLQAFTEDSYQKIVQANKEQTFLMVLWSIDCPPCHEELAHISAYIKAQPEHKIILISTDSDTQAVRQVLADNRLLHLESWMFSEPLAHRLRYAIDPHWYGELPRSYFFTKEHMRQAVSGRLSSDTIKHFFNTE